MTWLRGYPVLEIGCGDKIGCSSAVVQQYIPEQSRAWQYILAQPCQHSSIKPPQASPIIVLSQVSSYLTAWHLVMGWATSSTTQEIAETSSKPKKLIFLETILLTSSSIVFVHGLGGDKIGTWTWDTVKERSQFWPQSLLPKDCPTARILSFGYTAELLHFFPQEDGISKQLTIDDHSTSLMQSLVNLREETDTVCDSSS